MELRNALTAAASTESFQSRCRVSCNSPSIRASPDTSTPRSASTMPASASITLPRIVGQGNLDRGGGAFAVAQLRERPGGVRGGRDHRDPLQVDAHAVPVSHDSVDNRVTSRSTERAMADSTHPAKGPGRPYSSMPVVPS